MCTCIRPCSRLTDLPQALTTALPTPPRSSSSFPRPPLRLSWSSTSWHCPASFSSCAGAVFGARVEGGTRPGIVPIGRFCCVQPQARSVGQPPRSEEHTSELQSLRHLVCRLLLE